MQQRHQRPLTRTVYFTYDCYSISQHFNSIPTLTFWYSCLLLPDDDDLFEYNQFLDINRFPG